MTTLNEQRADRVLKMLRDEGYPVDEDNGFTAVGDLISELRHVADRCGFDFDVAAEHSMLHYAIEVKEDSYEVRSDVE